MIWRADDPSWEMLITHWSLTHHIILIYSNTSINRDRMIFGRTLEDGDLIPKNREYTVTSEQNKRGTTRQVGSVCSLFFLGPPSHHSKVQGSSGYICHVPYHFLGRGLLTFHAEIGWERSPRAEPRGFWTDNNISQLFLTRSVLSWRNYLPECQCLMPQLLSACDSAWIRQACAVIVLKHYEHGQCAVQ